MLIDWILTFSPVTSISQASPSQLETSAAEKGVRTLSKCSLNVA